jgi:hypothetical protein
MIAVMSDDCSKHVLPQALQAIQSQEPGVEKKEKNGGCASRKRMNTCLFCEYGWMD